MANVLQVIGLNTVTPQLEAGQTSNLDTYSMVSPLTIDPSGTAGYSGTNALTVTGNVSANALYQGTTNQAATTSIQLAASSVTSWIITGSGGQTIILPDATTLPVGALFTFNNNQSSGAITVNVFGSGSAPATVQSGGYATVTLLTKSVAAGTWDVHYGTPSNVTWSTNTFNYPGAITGLTSASLGTAAGLTLTPTTTGLAPSIAASGTDTNIPIALQSKGTGGIDLTAGANGLSLTYGTVVSGLQRVAVGSGYTSAPTVAISAPNLPSGVQATATVPISVVVTPTVSNTGTSGTYNTGDVLTVSGGTFTTAATITITASGGLVTGVSAFTAGAYTVYPGASPVATTSIGTGVGATFTLVFGISNVFTITAAGSGYVEQPTVTLSSGGGSGASVIAQLGTASGTNTTAVIRTPNQSSGNEALQFRGPFGNSTGIPMLSLRDISSADSYLRIQNGIAFANIYPIGNANAVLGIYANGTGQILLGTGGASQYTQCRITNIVSPVNYVTIAGSTTTNAPAIGVGGNDTNISLNLFTNGTGAINLRTGATTATQFTVSDTASAVNYWQFTGAATGGNPTVQVTGSDTTVNMLMSTKGGGAIAFRSYGLVNTQFRIYGTNAAINNLSVTGTTTGVAPYLSAEGTDTNVSLNLVTKGTGTLQINGTAWQKTNTLLFTTLCYYIAPSSTATTITVTGASWASNVATLTFTAITTAIPIGTVITVTGMTPSGYNASNVQITASSTTSVAFALFTNPGAFSVGGTITGGNTYTPSSGAVVLDVLVCSGGGGGGGGVVNAASVSGGASGGGGGSSNRRYRVAEIGGSATISLGAGGLSGGVGVAGGAGSTPSFAPLVGVTTALVPGAGGGGYFGGIAANTGGGGGGGGCYSSGVTGSATAGGAAFQSAGAGGFNGTVANTFVVYNLCGAPGTGGNGGAIGATGANGGNGAGFSATGGGSGGGNAAVSGGGGGLLSYGFTQGGAAGAAGPNAITTYPLFQGQGGGGGGGATTGTAGAGGNSFNGGGGGGGGSSASGTAAAGGKGGDGFVSIVEYF